MGNSSVWAAHNISRTSKGDLICACIEVFVVTTFVFCLSHERFGSTYSLTVVVQDEPDTGYPQIAQLTEFISQTFPGARLVEQHRVLILKMCLA